MWHVVVVVRLSVTLSCEMLLLLLSSGCRWLCHVTCCCCCQVVGDSIDDYRVTCCCCCSCQVVGDSIVWHVAREVSNGQPELQDWFRKLSVTNLRYLKKCHFPKKQNERINYWITDWWFDWRLVINSHRVKSPQATRPQVKCLLEEVGKENVLRLSIFGLSILAQSGPLE